MTTTVNLTTINIKPKQTLASLSIAIRNTKSADKSLKDIFEDVMVEFLPGKNVGVITATNGESYTKIAFPVEEPQEEYIKLRIEAQKFKKILQTFEKNDTLEFKITESNIQLKANSTKLKLAIKEPTLLEETLETIKFEKDKEIAEIEIKKLKQLVKEALSILKIDTEKTQEITFKTNNGNLSVRTGTTQKHTAMKSIEEANVFEENFEFSITKENAEILLNFLSVGNHTTCKISTDKSNSKIEFRTNYGIFVANCLNEHMTEAVYTIIQEAVSNTLAMFRVKKEDILEAIERISLIKTKEDITKIKLKNNDKTLSIEGKNNTGEIKQEIILKNEIDRKSEITAIDKVLENAVNAFKDTSKEDAIIIRISKIPQSELKVLMINPVEKPEFTVVMASSHE